MFQEIITSNPVKVIGLLIIAVSFVVLIKNPDRKLIDVLKKKMVKPLEDISSEDKEKKL